jgi:hypothetical protein
VSLRDQYRLLALFTTQSSSSTMRADFEGDHFFADFDIEILHSVDGGVAPHHRSPTSAMEPAGQDLGAPLAPEINGQYRSNGARMPVLSG